MTKLARKHQQGFTLIELLITVSIIAVLTVVGVAAFLNAQKKGRDARRKADLIAIKQSMENAFSSSATGAYPVGVAPAATAMANGVLPVDPLNAGAYIYTHNFTATSYCSCAVLEIVATGNANATTCAAGTFVANGNNFCVMQQQ